MLLSHTRYKSLFYFFMTNILINYCKNTSLLIELLLMNKKEKIDFSIIILNWNSLNYLKDCLDALKNQSYKSFELICVDNGSTDGSKEWIEKVQLDLFVNSPVKKILHCENIGFAAGMNSGIHAAEGRWIIPLNVDVFLGEKFLENAAKLFSENDDYQMLGAKIYKFDEKQTNEVICSGVWLTKNFSVSSLLTDAETEREVFGPAGCCPIFRSDALDYSSIRPDTGREKQFYDELYFAYGEDVDIYLRMNLMGFICLYSPKLIAWHAHSGTQDGVRWYTKNAATLGRLPANVFYTWLKNCPIGMLIKRMPIVIFTPLLMSLVLIFKAPAKCLFPLGAYISFLRNFKRTLRIRKQLKKMREGLMD